MALRQAITRAGWVRPLLALALGATRRRSWVEVRAGEVVARFGWWGRAEIPRSLVVGAREIRWRWWWGLGIRFYGRRAVGFVGASRPVVELDLAEPVAVRAVVTRRVTRLAVSVPDPAGLVTAVG